MYINESQCRYVCCDVAVRMQACKLHAQLMLTSVGHLLTQMKTKSQPSCLQVPFMVQQCGCANMKSKLMTFLGSQGWGKLEHMFDSNCALTHTQRNIMVRDEALSAKVPACI